MRWEGGSAPRCRYASRAKNFHVSRGLDPRAHNGLTASTVSCGSDVNGPSGQALLDSHIAEGPSVLDGMELDEAMEHDDGSWLAIVAGPSAEPCDDPGGKGERALGMRVLLPRGFAFEAGRDTLENRLVIGIESVFERTFGCTLALAHELQDGDGGDQAGSDQLLERAALGQPRGFNIEAVRLQGAEQLFDGPALAIEA